MLLWFVIEDEDDSGDNKASALSFKERRREAHTQVCVLTFVTKKSLKHMKCTLYITNVYIKIFVQNK